MLHPADSTTKLSIRIVAEGENKGLFIDFHGLSGVLVICQWKKGVTKGSLIAVDSDPLIDSGSLI